MHITNFNTYFPTFRTIKKKLWIYVVDEGDLNVKSWVGDGLDLTKTTSQLKTVKVVPTTAISDA